MPIEYTPTPTFHPTVTTPVDGDSATGASLVGIQQVADRTEHLRSINDSQNANAAFKNQANTFTFPQSIDPAQAETNATLQLNGWRADVPLISSNKTAGDHPGASGNLWKQIARLKRGGGAYVNVYVGVDALNQGAFAIVVNAYWDIATQKWVQDNPAANSTALLVRDAALQIGARFAGSGTWTTWDKGAALANAFVADNDVAAGVNFRYVNAIFRTVTINPGSGCGNGVVSLANAGTATEGFSYELAAGQRVSYPIVVPDGALLNNVKFKIVAGTAAYKSALHRRYNIDFAGSSPSYERRDFSNGTTSVAVTNKTLTWNGGGSLPDLTASANEDYDFWLQCDSATLSITAIQLSYYETYLRTFGPR